MRGLQRMGQHPVEQILHNSTRSRLLGAVAGLLLAPGRSVDRIGMVPSPSYRHDFRPDRRSGHPAVRILDR
jgi:hypothetical protein